MKSTNSKSSDIKQMAALKLSLLKEKSWWRIETALILGAVVVGSISGLMSHANDEATKQELAERFATTTVIQAAKDLKAGETLDRAKVVVSTQLSVNSTKNVVQPKSLPLIIGKRLAIDVKKGDTILLSAVQGAKQVGGMATRVPPGKRLFTLSVEDQASAAGFIQPNDHVDVLAHIHLPGRGMTTFTVLQDITLVSVGASTVIDPEEKASGSDVSFFIDVKDIEVMEFAKKKGSFSLSLRNPKDIGAKPKSKGIDVNDFLDYEGIHQVSGGGKLTLTERGKKLEEVKKK